MGRYLLKLSQDVPNAGGYHNMLRVGLPVQEDMVNNICIVAQGSYEFVPLNRNVLRDALLSSPEFCKQILGIEVKDATIKKEEEKPNKKVTKKGEAK